MRWQRNDGTISHVNFDMKASEIKQVVENQQKMRRDYVGMERDALRELVCEDGFAAIVTGVRRSGKSTLLNQWAESRRERVVSVHFDDLRLSSFSTSDFAVLEVNHDGRMIHVVPAHKYLSESPGRHG